MTPGEILRLYEPLPHVPEGEYVLLKMGKPSLLARLREDAGGNLCASGEQIEVPLEEMYRFIRTGLSVSLEPQAPPQIRRGDVLHLPENLGEIEGGHWVVTEIGYMVTLNRMGENEDRDPCIIHRQVKTTWAELAHFVRAEFNL